ncbi:MAG: DNA methyltransferase [Chloroflexota bacterium]|nr:DNA methyltransferase [Chloroflexota bacterium]
MFRSQSMGARPNLCFEWRGFRNPHPSGWRLSKERLEEEYQKGNVVIRPDGNLERRKYLDDYEGIPVDDFWGDIPRLTDGNERSGYPTQKPLALYERIILASSNPGDLVLDPFAGCATTPVAAERLGRQWVGMDIWDGAIDEVRRRMADSRQLLTDANPQIVYATIPPERTDGNDDGPEVPDLALRPQRQPEHWERLSHAEMRDILASAQANGDSVVCAGCGIQLPVRYMELDHREPRKDGGQNVITNRILLCGPCNGAKSANLTLSGLVRHNRRLGFEVDRGLAELAAIRARDAAQRCRDTIR